MVFYFLYCNVSFIDNILLYCHHYLIWKHFSITAVINILNALSYFLNATMYFKLFIYFKKLFVCYFIILLWNVPVLFLFLWQVCITSLLRLRLNFLINGEIYQYLYLSLNKIVSTTLVSHIKLVLLIVVQYWFHLECHILISMFVLCLGIF